MNLVSGLSLNSHLPRNKNLMRTLDEPILLCTLELWLGVGLSLKFLRVQSIKHENHDIAIAMSPSRADPVLPWLGVFKCLYQSHCTDWGDLNI